MVVVLVGITLIRWFLGERLSGDYRWGDGEGRGVVGCLNSIKLALGRASLGLEMGMESHVRIVCIPG